MEMEVKIIALEIRLISYVPITKWSADKSMLNNIIEFILFKCIMLIGSTF